MEISSNRAPLSSQPATTDKRLTGATEAAETPLEIRSLEGAVSPELQAWVHERLGRQLGKYATQIERVEVRFGDENGPKGGVDRNCMIHIHVSTLAPVVVEVRAGEDREAFDLAAGRAERALRHSMQKHGFHTKHKGRQRTPHAAPDQELVMASLEEAGMLEARAGTEDGSDTHTSERNLKTHTSGMAYALEDSATGKPSRKSTRGGKHHIKHDNGLTIRTKDAVHSPSQRAQRAR